jgi:hypothetical protein
MTVIVGGNFLFPALFTFYGVMMSRLSKGIATLLSAAALVAAGYFAGYGGRLEDETDEREDAAQTALQDEVHIRRHVGNVTMLTVEDAMVEEYRMCSEISTAYVSLGFDGASIFQDVVCGHVMESFMRLGETLDSRLGLDVEEGVEYRQTLFQGECVDDYSMISPER